MNNTCRISHAGVIHHSLSDHFLVYCIIKSGIPKGPPRLIDYRSFKKFNQADFIADLEKVPWSIIETFEDIDDTIFTWNRLFLEVANEHAPAKRLKIKGNSCPWMNKDILCSMQKRDFHHRKAVKSNSPHHWPRFREMRKKVNRDVNEAKSTYFTQLIEKTKGN